MARSRDLETTPGSSGVSPDQGTRKPPPIPESTGMDRRAWSFLSLGIFLGALLTTGVFTAITRADKTPSPSPGDPMGEKIASTGGRPRADVVQLKLAHALDPGHPVHRAMEFMGRRLAETSRDRIELQIFPSGQLGSETDTIEQLQRGVLAMAKSSAAPLESFIPQMALFGLPYLFEDKNHYWTVLEGSVGQELLLSGRKLGLRGLCYFDAGSRSFYTIDAPVHTPADLRGKKIRVMRSRTAMDMISALGGSPTPMPFGELYTALQQGMVDGAENNPPSFLGSRHFEVARYYSLDEHARIPDILLFSEKVWSSLSSEVQRWVSEAAEEASRFQRKLWEQETNQALADLKKAGVSITEPDKEPFRAEVQSMYEKLESHELRALVQKVRAAR